MGKVIVPPNGLMPVKTIEGITYLDFSQIIRCEADSKYTLIYCINQPKAIRSLSSLSAIEEQLPDELFFRCHRSQIISLRHLKKFVRYDRKIYLIDDHTTIIPEKRIPGFLKRTDPGYPGK